MNYTVLTPSSGNSIRREFSGKNINFRQQTFFNAGYNGCSSPKTSLWERFKSYSVITQNTALKILNEMPNVYVTWESNSVKISRSLQKSRMIKLSGRELFKAITYAHENPKARFSPTEFYCISEDMSLFVVFTRVSLNGLGRICLTNSKNPPQCSVPNVYKPMFECFRGEII